MRLACRLINGNDIDFECAIVEITPDYAAYLLRLVDEAKRFNESHNNFYAIELFDSSVEYGSHDGLEDLDYVWEPVSDDVQLNRESTSAGTVVVSSDSICWKAAAKYSDIPMYYETATLNVDELQELLKKYNPGEFENATSL